MISYFKTVSSKASTLTWPIFEKMLDDQNMQFTLMNIRACDSAEGRQNLKKKLPAITWQSFFE